MIIGHYVYVTFIHILSFFEGDFSAPPIGSGRNDGKSIKILQVSLILSVLVKFLLKL